MDTLIKRTISDIDELVDNLGYLKTFLEKVPDEKELEVYGRMLTIHTEIQILSNKLKRK